LNDWTQKELKKKVLEGRPKKLLRNHWHDKKGKMERRLASVEEWLKFQLLYVYVYYSIFVTVEPV
jgi:hypothetical protein